MRYLTAVILVAIGSVMVATPTVGSYLWLGTRQKSFDQNYRELYETHVVSIDTVRHSNAIRMASDLDLARKSVWEYYGFGSALILGGIALGWLQNRSRPPEDAA